MVTVRQYVLWSLTVLTSGWLILLSFPLNLSVLSLMATDGCWQILYPERLQTFEILASVLR